jgi:hypothetical protein
MKKSKGLTASEAKALQTLAQKNAEVTTKIRQAVGNATRMTSTKAKALQAASQANAEMTTRLRNILRKGAAHLRKQGEEGAAKRKNAKPNLEPDGA